MKYCHIFSDVSASRNGVWGAYSINGNKIKTRFIANHMGSGSWHELRMSKIALQEAVKGHFEFYTVHTDVFDFPFLLSKKLFRNRFNIFLRKDVKLQCDANDFAIHKQCHFMARIAAGVYKDDESIKNVLSSPIWKYHEV